MSNQTSFATVAAAKIGMKPSAPGALALGVSQKK